MVGAGAVTTVKGLLDRLLGKTPAAGRAAVAAMAAGSVVAAGKAVVAAVARRYTQAHNLQYCVVMSCARR